MSDKETMSEAAKDTEAEDVLASIRKLVSEEKHPQRESPAWYGPPADTCATESVDVGVSPTGKRFLLTPSLRVKDPALRDAWPSDAEEAEEDAPPEGKRARSDGQDWPDEASLDPAASMGDTTGAPAIGAEFQAVEEVARTGVPGTGPGNCAMAATQNGSDPARDDAHSSVEGCTHFAVPVLQAEDGQRAAASVSNEEIDMAEDRDDPTKVLKLDDAVRLPDAAVEDHVAQTKAMPAESAATTVDGSDVDVSDIGYVKDIPRSKKRSPVRANRGNAALDSALGEKIAALEAAIARTAGDWEPDGVVKNDYSGTVPPAMDWDNAGRVAFEDASTGPLRLEPQDRSDTPLDEVMQAAPIAAGTAGTTHREMQSSDQSSALMRDHMDDAALREFIAGVVRQELNGALGERITRNVRKLVRREILRALDARDSD